MNSRSALVGVCLAAALLTLFRLGVADVCSYNEAVEGLFVQQMVEHGRVLFPVANGRDPMYKPPLFHWTALAIHRALGIHKVTALSLRLPSALYALAGVIVTVVFTYRWMDDCASALAGLALLGSYQYISQGRFGRVDMTLTFCEALALFSFLWWMLANRAAGDREEFAQAPAMRWLFAVALGMGMLAKGPVGVILPLASVAVFITVNRYWQVGRKLFSPGSGLLAIVLGSSWYLACFIGGRHNFLIRQVGTENFGRFFGTLGAMPPWYYLTPILINSGPLSLLALAVIVSALMLAARGRGSDREAGAMLDIPWCLAIFWVITVGFFTLAAYKRRAYLLPLWPPAAVLIAWWLQTQVPHNLRRIVRGSFVVICAALMVFNLVYIPHHEAAQCGKGSFRQAASEINRIVGADEPLFIYGMVDPAALLFYLDRSVPLLKGNLGDAPPGYIIVPANIWDAQRHHAPGLDPILGPTPGQQPLILLHQGKVYATLGLR